MKKVEVFNLSVEDQQITLTLDVGLYPIEVVYGAAYVFIDRAYVLLDRKPSAEAGQPPKILVHLRARKALSAEVLADLAGEFANECLAQALRRKITKTNGKIVEEIVTAAIAGAAGATLPQDFLDEDAGADVDFLDDPLGIAVPWEERFKKKAPAPAEGGEAP
jgi:His-Xaa-Ser system protein HxsD